MRANGVASKRSILDAAAELASERGYQGTSISAVSRRSGLPNSSIYWHFENKEDLFAEVIDDSYARWRQEYAATRGEDNGVASAFERLYASLEKFPDFLRLGLILTLERAPDGDGTALRRFFQLRQESLASFKAALLRDHPYLDDDQGRVLATMTLSLIDGSFVAAKAGEPPLTPETLNAAINTIAESMRPN